MFRNKWFQIVFFLNSNTALALRRYEPWLQLMITMFVLQNLDTLLRYVADIVEKHTDSEVSANRSHTRYDCVNKSLL